MMQEFEEVVFTMDIPEYHIAAVDMGTVVDVIQGCVAYQVEVFFVNGDTYNVITAGVEQIRPILERDLRHARKLPELTKEP